MAEGFGTGVFTSNRQIGAFIDLVVAGNEILSIVQDGYGIYSSKDGGKVWYRRYSSKSQTIGQFKSMAFQNGVVLAQTTTDVFISKDGGRVWLRRMDK